MKPSLYDAVHELVLDIVNASSVSDRKLIWSSYQKLAQVCEENEFNDNNHPFQWETLADFTSDRVVALEIYCKALAYANEKGLSEYIASICFAISETYFDLGDVENSKKYATRTNDS